MSWYTLQTKPNYEAKVTEKMEEKISKGLPVREVFSPVEIIFELKNGVKKEKKKRIYPNYIFVEMDYTDNVWHEIKDIKGVIKFIGLKGKPAIVPDKDIEMMKNKLINEVPKPKIVFDIESKVRIANGSFADFYGIVRAVDYAKNKAKVAVNIFSRETEVELDLSSLEHDKS